MEIVKVKKKDLQMVKLMVNYLVMLMVKLKRSVIVKVKNLVMH
jgi:hypothetical protein